MISSKRKPSNIVVAILVYGSLALVALVCVLPMWHVLMASLSEPLRFAVFKGFLLKPLGFSFESYQLLFKHQYLLRSYGNTIFYTAASTALGLIISMMAAYALSRKKMILRTPLLILILVTMFFNGGLVPFYIVVNQLGMIDTVWSMILPTCCNALNVILLRNGIMTIPEAVSEAAEIDGAGPVRILVRVILPLSVPYLIVVALFNGVANWNSWVNASLFVTREHQELYPLQLVLRDILMTENAGGITSNTSLPISLYLPVIRMAAVIVASLPLIIAYPFLQQYFEKGIIIGSVKG